MMNMENRVAVVTGGAKGIGLETARLFIREGCKVALFDRDEVSGRSAAMELGANCTFHPVDISQSAAIREAMDAVITESGRIDFLVNNAGIIKYATAENCAEADWDEIMDVNLKAAFLCSKYSIPAMKAQGGGVIINVSSVQAFVSSANMVHYTTSKTALLGLTRSMAIDFAPSIRVLAVCPGTVDTPMARNAWATAADPEAVHQDSIQMHLLKRIGKAVEVAELIVFLCSDKAAFMTGQAIRIDGGLGIEVAGSVRDENPGD